jgi:hypothetical protein
MKINSGMSTVTTILLVTSLALAGSTWSEVYRGVGSGDSRDNACSSANSNATMNAIVACTAHRPIGAQSDVNDKGCSCQCETIGDNQLCTCTDTMVITCQSNR